MANNAKAPAGIRGNGGAGMDCTVTEQSNIPIAESLIRGIDVRYSAGLLALEFHVNNRSRAQLLDDLRMMNQAPAKLSAVLHNHRELTLRALRDGGAA